MSESVLFWKIQEDLKLPQQRENQPEISLLEILMINMKESYPIPIPTFQKWLMKRILLSWPKKNKLIVWRLL